MKKILLTFICCLVFLLYIPFSTFAVEYNGELTDLEQITEFQVSKINELFDTHTNENLLILYSYGTHNLIWSYDIQKYDSTNGYLTVYDRFTLTQDGSIKSTSSSLTVYLTGQYYILYAYYNNQTIFKNNNLNKISFDENTLLFSTGYDNIVRSRTSSFVTSSQARYYSTIDYDITHVIKGKCFDVYYLVNDTYKLIQSSINSFSLHSHDSKTNFKDSSNSNAYPDYPTIPNNSIEIYTDSFTHGNYYFKINNDSSSNNIIVKAPDTDNLLTDGNSNSQSATTNNNQSNQLLDNTVNQMDKLENGYKSDLNNNLNNINVNDYNITGITQLSNAANFVKVQFDNLTKNNPFGTILGFSLFLGLSLLIIGKRL